MAYLRLIVGPMFSGKTTHLLEDLTMYANLGFRVLYINHVLDTRQSPDGFVSSHNGEIRIDSRRLRGCKAEVLCGVAVEEYDVVGIDEGQFFADLPEAAREWISAGKRVVVAGLDGDFRAEPFGRIHELLCLCDEIVKLRAKCHRCLRRGELVDAPFSRRLVAGQEVVEIGGQDKYEAVCRRCRF